MARHQPHELLGDEEPVAAVARDFPEESRFDKPINAAADCLERDLHTGTVASGGKHGIGEDFVENVVGDLRGADMRLEMKPPLFVEGEQATGVVQGTCSRTWTWRGVRKGGGY